MTGYSQILICDILKTDSHILIFSYSHILINLNSQTIWKFAFFIDLKLTG